MSFFEFPHTRNYDSDLGWIIQKVKFLLEEYAGLLEQVNENTEQISELSETLTKSLAEFRAELDDFADTIEEYKTYVDTSVANLTTYVDNVVLELESLVDGLEARLRAYALELYQDGKEYSDYKNDILKLEIDHDLANLKAYVDSLIPDMKLISPFTGKLDTLQNIINTMSDYIRSGAFTCHQWDTSNITCAQFDGSISAYDFDFYGYNTFIGDDRLYMYHPYTGERVLIPVVVEWLAAFHMDGATATHYDSLDYTATTYDALDYTATEYDSISSLLTA